MIVHCDKCGKTVRFKPCDKLGVESVFCDCGEEVGEVRVLFVPVRKGLFRISENGKGCQECHGTGVVPVPDELNPSGPPIACGECDGTGMTSEDLEFIEVQKIDGKRADAIAKPRPPAKVGFTQPKQDDGSPLKTYPKCPVPFKHGKEGAKARIEKLGSRDRREVGGRG